MLDVSPIIGPPYACMGVGPVVGPVFGDTEVSIAGLNFRDGKIEVKFGAGKTEAVVLGKFVDEKTITCRTPNFEGFGALPVDVRVSINNEGWTVNKVTFTYFANPSAKFSIAYGPGVLPTGIAGIEMPFVIQSKDTCNNKRTTGGDRFIVEVTSEDGKQKGTARIVDMDTGLYEVYYTAPSAGKYSIKVLFDELGEAPAQVPIRGSPFKVDLQDPWTYAKIEGAQPAKPKDGRLLSLAGHEVAFYNPADGSVMIGSHEKETWAFAEVPVAEGAAKVSGRKQPAAFAVSKDELVISGGVDGNGREIDDLWFLHKEGDAWSWRCCKSLSHVAAPQETAAPAAPVAPAAEGEAVDGEAVAAAPAEGEDPAPAAAPAPAEEGPKAWGRYNHAGIPLSGFTAGAASEKKAMIFGGIRELTIKGELEVFDLAADGQGVEVSLKGDLPPPRRATSMCPESRSVAYMFGGIGVDVMEEEVVLGDMYRFTAHAKTLTIERLECTGAVPGPRFDAALYHYDKGKLVLYGGFTRNEEGKESKLNDAYVFDTEKKVWSMLYCGGPDLGPAGPMTMFKTSLCGLSGPAAAPQYTTAGSLDLVAKHESFQFMRRMKTEGISQLERVAGWIEYQATGLDMAFNVEALQQDFTRLVKVLEALFNVRAKAMEVDLEIDQIKEIMIHLKKAKVPNLVKYEKELDETELRWGEIKKEGPNVRKMVEELQKQEGERIKREIYSLEEECKAYRKAFLAKPFLLFDTGYKAATQQLEREVLPQTKALQDKVAEYSNYANIFEFPELVSGARSTLTECAEDAAAANDTWEMVNAALEQNNVWANTPWSKVSTDALDTGARNFVKDKRNLPKRANDMNVFKGYDAFLKNLMTTVPMVADLRSPAMRPRHWELLQVATKKTFTMDDNFKLGDLLALELHKFEEEVSEIVDRAQKEDKLESGLGKLRDIWAKVDFDFTPHKGSEVHTVKMKDEDFEILEDNRELHRSILLGIEALALLPTIFFLLRPTSPDSYINFLFLPWTLSSSSAHEQRCWSKE